MGIIPYSKNFSQNQMKGFLFEKCKNEEIYFDKKYFTSIFEMFFMSNEGSVKCFNEKIEFFDFEYEKDETYEKIQNVQKGAISFIEDLKYSDFEKYIDINEENSLLNMLQFGNYPNKEDTEMFGDLTFFDDKSVFFAKKQSILFYIMHPKAFLKDLYDSAWMPAFIKRNLKLNLFNYVFFKMIKFKRRINWKS